MNNLPEAEGWFPDPNNRDLERYFDGVKWTLQLRFPSSDTRPPIPPDFSNARRAEEIWSGSNGPTNPRLAADRAARIEYQKKRNKKGLSRFFKGRGAR